MSEEDEISSKRAKGPLDVSRRALLIGAGSTAALLGLGALRYAGHNPLVRPPGGQDEARLVSACIRCEKCYEACPRGVIVPAHIEDGLLGMRSPALKFDADFCDYCADENGGEPLCVKVCPTEALALLVVCLAGWALDVPARLEGLTLPGGSSSSATVKEGQDWPAMVGDRLVSEKPEKVVSLSPMITEALLSLPGHEALCAVTEYCDARSTGLATVGTPLLPRTEDIIALAPDYVLCQTPLAGPVQTELEEAGVEVIQMDTPADLAALREFYGQLGALLGGNETGRALGYGVIDRLESTLAAYDAALPEKASALLLPDLSGLAATADTAEWTLLGQVFRHPLPDAADWLAGAECLTDEDAGNDLDQIRAADPDVLLVADTVSPEDLSAALGDLRAVQNGAVVYVDIRLTETLSPRLVFAIADAAALAYPEFAPAS